MADNRHVNRRELGRLVRGADGFGAWREFDGRPLHFRGHVVEQVVHTEAVLGGDRKGRRDAQAAEILGLRLERKGVSFVDGQCHGLARAVQEPGKLLIQRQDARAPVHHQHQLVGLVNGHLRLAENFRRHLVRTFWNQAACVHDLELFPQPFGRRVEAVARHAGLVAHQRPAAPANTVEERGLAHVRPAKNGNARDFVHH